ncbi:hypothetical protein LXM94_20845 [Rhizobium sp. TRM95111]|uniref:hypothetical protein n=1 Tax=Rhizobium alarense TaxID=2846851 RepID=UPI001F2E2C5A|nr:hypothetical protein [Rhizobium alarense]MCF3642422.1 hypothetical protein [Rhizobium alarense]
MAAEKSKTYFGVDPRTREIVIGTWRMRLPQSRLLRIAIGCLLILGGILGFLPVLGFWMVPLGLLVLSHDSAFARRQRRRLAVWWGNRRSTRRR